MKSGIQYNADLSVKSAVESGLEYVELNIDDIDNDIEDSIEEGDDF